MRLEFGAEIALADSQVAPGIGFVLFKREFGRPITSNRFVSDIAGIPMRLRGICSAFGATERSSSGCRRGCTSTTTSLPIPTRWKTATPTPRTSTISW